MDSSGRPGDALAPLFGRIRELVEDAQAVSKRIPPNDCAGDALKVVITSGLSLLEPVDEEIVKELVESARKLAEGPQLLGTGTRSALPLPRGTGLEQLAERLVELAKDAALLADAADFTMGLALLCFSESVWSCVQVLYEVFPAVKPDKEPRGFCRNPGGRRAAYLGSHRGQEPFLMGGVMLEILKEVDLRDEYPVPGRAQGPGVGSEPIPEEIEQHLTVVEIETLCRTIEQHFTVVEIETLCRTTCLYPWEAVRLMLHLPGRCQACWQAVASASAVPAGSWVPDDPLLRALRVLTSGVPEDLSPVRRLALAKASCCPVTFCRLVLEESLGLALSSPADGLGLIWWGMQLVFLPAFLLPPKAQNDVLGLTHHYRAEVLGLLGQRAETKRELLLAIDRLDHGSGSQELYDSHLEISARLCPKPESGRIFMAGGEEIFSKVRELARGLKKREEG